MYDMTHPRVWHDVSHIGWAIFTTSCLPFSSVWNDSLMRVTRINTHQVDNLYTHEWVMSHSIRHFHICDMTHSQMWHIHMCDMTHSLYSFSVFHFHICDMTHSQMWHIHMCDVTHSRVKWHAINQVNHLYTLLYAILICVTWLIHVCDIFICVTWLIHVWSDIPHIRWTV